VVPIGWGIETKFNDISDSTTPKRKKKTDFKKGWSLFSTPFFFIIKQRVWIKKIKINGGGLAIVNRGLAGHDQNDAIVASNQSKSRLSSRLLFLKKNIYNKIQSTHNVQPHPPKKKVEKKNEKFQLKRKKYYSSRLHGEVIP
jgi:hypothetical protein